MKIRTKNLLFSSLFLFCFSPMWAQIATVQYGKTYTFKSTCEVQKGNISKDQLSIYLSEHDLNDGKEKDNDNSAPKNLGLHIHLDLINGFKFPIKPEDSVILNLTSIQKGLGEYKIVKNKVDNYDEENAKNVASDIETLRKSKEARLKVLAERVKNGDMTALEEIQKINEELMVAVDEGLDKVDVDMDVPDKSSFEIVMTDTYTKEESKMYSGTIYIKYFDGKRFEAEFSGQFMTDCMGSRVNDACQTKESTLIKDTKVLKEGSVKGSVNVELKTFNDNR